eukprot:symbB.v1.2.019516.t1/scaffold1454.1/size117754/2
MALRLAVLLSLVAPALAWYRTAISVTGDVVKGAGNLTMGGKVGTYTVLLQVLNPPAGELELLLECCGDAANLAGEAAIAINENTAGSYDQIKSTYKGTGKCSEPGVLELLNQGNPKCNYMYSFKNKDWAKYKDTAYCVPSDVCSVDVVGATKGLALTYGVVLQILNIQAGDLQYAGKGPIGSCLAGMNSVNTANHTAYDKEKDIHIDLFGTKVPVGKQQYMEIEGMKQLNPIELLSKCQPESDTGILYIYSNKFWDNHYQSMNISGFNAKADAKLQAEEAAKWMKENPEIAAKIDKIQGVEPKKASSKPPAMKGFDLAKALGAIAGAVKTDLKDPKVADSTKATKAAMNKEEAKEEKVLEAKAEEKKEEAAAQAPPPVAPKVGGSFGYGGFPEEKVPETSEVEGLGYGGTMDTEAAEKILTAAAKKAKEAPAPEVPEVPKVAVPVPAAAPKAPPAPKVPKVPKVEVPEAPKAPPAPKVPKVPKVEVPEAPKAPPAPKVPEVPKVEVPEAPKAPPAPKVPKVPKVELPEAPKAAAIGPTCTKGPKGPKGGTARSAKGPTCTKGPRGPKGGSARSAKGPTCTKGPRGPKGGSA